MTMQPAPISFTTGIPLQAVRSAAHPSGAEILAPLSAPRYAREWFETEARDAAASGAGTPYAGHNELVLLPAEAFGETAALPPSNAFFAQHVAQEILPEGLYIDPHPAGIAAYRDVLSAIDAASTATAGLDLQV